MPTIEEQFATILKQQASIMETLVKQQGEMVQKTPAQFQTANRLHGSGGLFSTPGLEREIITAHIRPSGIGGMLPTLPSVDENPVYGSITGITAPVGAQPSHSCDDAPYAYLKGCNLTARFGRIRYDTNTIDMNVVMRKLNRADYTDLVLRGRMLGLTDVGPQSTEGDMLNTITQSEMVTVGVLFERELTRQMWQGSFAIANEFPGLDVQIATGQRDSDTGALCPALDSDVKSYGLALMTDTIAYYLATLEFYLHNNATKMGLMPVQWIIVMRPELWEELTAIYPCAYYTNKCNTALAAGTVMSVDGREMVALRDAMRNGMYIDINGRRYPVAVDDGIFEMNNTNTAGIAAGDYASSIYMVPLTIVGGMPVTFRQFLDYRQAQPDIALLHGLQEFWTDGGIYTWALEQIKWCYKLAAKTEQRIVLRTPQLAGRIDRIRYRPLQHLRSSDPASAYFMDGGVSVRPGLATPYAVWSGR